MGYIYGTLEEFVNHNSHHNDFDDFVRTTNECFSFEGLKIEKWETLETLMELYYSGGTETVFHKGKKLLQLTDYDYYCYLENGEIIIMDVDTEEIGKVDCCKECATPCHPDDLCGHGIGAGKCCECQKCYDEMEQEEEEEELFCKKCELRFYDILLTNKEKHGDWCHC